MSKVKKIVLDPIFNNNPIAAQILGICSALAVTTKLAPAIIMYEIFFHDATLCFQHWQSCASCHPILTGATRRSPSYGSTSSYWPSRTRP